MDETSFAAIALAVLLLMAIALYSPGRLPVTGFATSQVGNLTVGVTTYVSCIWSNDALNVSFGSSLNPGSADNNATKNYAYNQPNTNGTNYNVSVDTITNVNVNVTVKGADLVAGANVLGVTNVSWWSNQTSSNSTYIIASNAIPVTTAYNLTYPVASALAPGSTAWFRFWLDVPNGQVAGSYVGNYTQQCAQS